MDASQDWVAAGFAELATAGIDGVRVEVLAERLGVTKGGFYRRFRDRRALLDAMLAAWRGGRIAAIERQSEAGGETPIARLEALIELYTLRTNAAGLAVELAIRQWARTDRRAAAAVQKVDAARLEIVAIAQGRLRQIDEKLRQLSEMRAHLQALCDGSWSAPDTAPRCPATRLQNTP